MIHSRDEIRGRYGFSRDEHKDETECRECVYLEGLRGETKVQICQICDDYRMCDKEHVRKYEDIKYSRKEVFKMLIDP